MKTRIWLPLTLSLLYVPHISLAEECSTPTVIVMIQIGDNTYDQLVRDYHFNPKDYWASELGGKTNSIIKSISGGIRVSSIDEIVRSVQDDSDYLKNNPDVRAALRSEYLLRIGIYWLGNVYKLYAYVTSIDTARIVKMVEGQGRNVYTELQRIMGEFGDLLELIRMHEVRYPAPPRDPTDEITVDPEEIWPEAGKDRCGIRVKLTHCNGLPVYVKFRGHKVFFEKETERGKNKTGLADGSSLTNPQGEAKVDYRLDYAKGTDPGTDVVRIRTYGRGQRKFDLQATVEIVAEMWEGAIVSSFLSESRKDQSIITSLFPGGEYRGMEDWTLHVVFQRVRGNERIQAFQAKSAKLIYTEMLTAKSEAKDSAKGVKVKFLDLTEDTEIPGRTLNNSEYKLELIFDVKKQTYVIDGMLEILGVDSRSREKFEVRAKNVIRKDLSELDATEKDIKEEIHLTGSFAGEIPEKLEGFRDMIEEMGIEPAQALKDMAGNVSWTLSWQLKRKKGK